MEQNKIHFFSSSFVAYNILCCVSIVNYYLLLIISSSATQYAFTCSLTYTLPYLLILNLLNFALCAQSISYQTYIFFSSSLISLTIYLSITITNYNTLFYFFTIQLLPSPLHHHHQYQHQLLLFHRQHHHHLHDQYTNYIYYELITKSKSI